MANSNHACINTKLLAMKSKMLKDEDYQALMKAPSLRDLFDYLKQNTYYGPFLESVPADHLHRPELEVPLTRLKIYEVEKLMHYLQSEEKLFFRTLLIRPEIESLRVLIRGIARGENLEDLSGFLVYSDTYSNLPFDKLLKAKDWDSFKKFLIGTDYYRLLEIYKQITVEDDLFPIEKGLERYYYDKIKNILQKLNKKQNAELIKAMREAIDLLNLVWFYRGKKFYHLSREELLAYSLRGGLKVKEKDIQQMSEIKNMEDLQEVMKDYSDYAFLFNHTKTLDLYMERRRERFMYYTYLKLFNGREAGLGKAVAFYRLTEYEIEDITSIIESKRYGMSAEETEKFLIRSFE